MKMQTSFLFNKKFRSASNEHVYPFYYEKNSDLHLMKI